MSNVLINGGGAGFGSHVIVLKNNQLYACDWLKLQGSFENAEEIYLSVIEENGKINLLELEGDYNGEQLNLIGRDFNNNKTYYIHVGFNFKEYEIKDGIDLDGKPLNRNAYTNISKVKPFLYEVGYDTLDYEYAKNYFLANQGNEHPGACSAIRKGNFYGRNFDLNYDYKSEFVIRTSRFGNRKASLGVVSNITALTEDVVDSQIYVPEYKILPFYLMDGINEDGVFMNVNLVPNDKGITYKTVPYIEERESICMTMLSRYVLDRFSSADEAIDYLKNYVSVYTPKPLIDKNYESHYMIGDANKTYIIEFVDDADHVRRINSIEHNIMTNFYIDGVTFNNNGTVYTPATQDADHNAMITNGITKYGQGLERYNLIVNTLGNITTPTHENIRDIMNNLTYTKSYDLTTDPFWYTEFVGGNLTVISDPTEFGPEVDKAIEEFEHRDRSTGTTWQTVHSSVYDIENKKLYIISQEDGHEYEFNFKQYYTADEVEKLIEEKIHEYINK